MLEGGIDLSQDNAVFSFELNESLYFERGQEVAEILGISLDPEISIQPFNDYISIRGVIELTGEYQRAGINTERSEDDSLFDVDDYSTRRYMEQVVDTDRGEATFSHRFPVEISVPTYRVNDLNDVTVSVDYFDYEIPDQSQIRLKSIIAIQGINDSAVTPEEQQYDEVIEKQDKDVVSFEKNETFRFDIKKSEEDKTDSELVDNQQVESRKDNIEQEEVVKEQLDISPSSFVQSSEEEDIKEEKYEQAQSREEKYEQEEVVEQESSYSPSSFINFSEDKEIEHKKSRGEYVQQGEGVEEESYSSPRSSVKSSEGTDEAEKPSGEKIDYLSDMFREDEESYSKMKLCIVQDTDTIETIAQRYQVNPLHISKRNHLDDEVVSEGQLLFIPEK